MAAAVDGAAASPLTAPAGAGGEGMPRVSIGDADIYYERSGAGPPLVLSPGLGGVGRVFAAQVPLLAKSFEVVTYDHRGCGQSTPSRIRYSVAQMASDVVKLIDALKLGRVSYLGHSTGGAIGQILALDHADRIDRLVLSATWNRSDEYFKRSFAARKLLLEKGGPEVYTRASNLALFPPWFVNQEAARLAEIEQANLAAFPAVEIVLSRIDAISVFDRAADTHRIAAPTLVICAEDDIVTPMYFSKELARRIPNSMLRTLGTGGHMMMLTLPDAYGRLVADFLTTYGRQI
jgi:aminoacrylate hydrolase